MNGYYKKTTNIEHFFASGIDDYKCTCVINVYWYASVSPHPDVEIQCKLGLSDKYLRDIKNNAGKYLDSTFKPNLGDKIHVVQPSKYSVADVRNSYAIARDFDGGVCNVFSDINTKNVDYSYTYNYVVNRTKKHIYLRADSFNTAEDGRAIAIKAYVNDFPDCKDDVLEAYSCFDDEDNDIISRNIVMFKDDKFSSALYSAMTKSSKTPCIYIDSLGFDKTELTIDVLDFVERAALMSERESGSLNNFITQLSLLNQHNWHEYPGTMSLFFSKINSECFYSSCFDFYNKAQSKLPKHLKALFSRDNRRGDVVFGSEKDLEFSKAYVRKLLQLDDIEFVNTRALIDKLSQAYIPLDVFNKMFNIVTRIKDKDWKEYESNQN